MDDETVLRELGADLERDDPALAALLSGAAPPRGHRTTWIVLGLLTVGIALVIAPAVTFGVLAMLLVLASPLLAVWWCAFPGDEPTTGRG